MRGRAHAVETPSRRPRGRDERFDLEPFDRKKERRTVTGWVATICASSVERDLRSMIDLVLEGLCVTVPPSHIRVT